MGLDGITELFLLIGFIGLAGAGEYCWNDGCTELNYCDYGCCGGSNCNEYCCSNTVGIIVGAVIGGLVFLAFVAFVVWFCCIYKTKRSTGMVVAPQTTTTTTVIQGHGYVQPMNQPQGPQFGYGVTQPSYGFNQSAYPAGPMPAGGPAPVGGPTTSSGQGMPDPVYPPPPPKY